MYSKRIPQLNIKKKKKEKKERKEKKKKEKKEKEKATQVFQNFGSVRKGQTNIFLLGLR